MAGSKVRANIQGNIVLADPDVIKKLRHLPAEDLKSIFAQGKDHGSAPLMIDGVQYILQRQSDHTFLCAPGDSHRYTV